MNIRVLFSGKTNKSYISDSIADYQKKIKPFCKLQVDEIKLPGFSKAVPNQDVKKKEGEVVLKKIAADDFVVLLDESGKEMDSRKFAELLKRWSTRRTIIFLSAGAYGASPDVKNRADYKLSLSKMTFSHQNIRLIFLEQLYRAFTIINNLKYHND